MHTQHPIREELLLISWITHSPVGHGCQVDTAFILRNAAIKLFFFLLFPVVLVASDLTSGGTLKSTVALILTSALLTTLAGKQINYNSQAFFFFLSSDLQFN